ncbi:GTP cyclohydrolase II [Oleispirillum naphthae]|uniref:GTP cyclohydrolase II n=1 Tax=Oleispirillum naphthae TaxID=2838853 RepID=UPI00308223DF
MMSRPILSFPGLVLSPSAEGTAAWLPETDALLSVNRIVDDVRRGAMAGLRRSAAGRAVAVLALEAAGRDPLAAFAETAGGAARLAMTGRRAVVLGLWPEDAAEPPKVVVVEGDLPVIADLAAAAVDPIAAGPFSAPGITVRAADADGLAAAAVHLMKRARLMPAAAVVDVTPDRAAALPLLWAEAADVLHHEHLLALSLQPVSRAHVPLADALETTVIAFRPSDGGIEHLALLIGEPEPGAPVLTRLHSECFTGDLLGSLRCDCGDQLRGAIKEIGERGAGILLYMAQEGRGIGLVNKLRAYTLQDAGFDTMEANEQLGFDDDERIYLPAAAMLRQLGFSQVRLMTNNPAKVEALARHGVAVVERVPHVFPSNDHNRSYLEAKRTKGGHLF